MKPLAVELLAAAKILPRRRVPPGLPEKEPRRILPHRFDSLKDIQTEKSGLMSQANTPNPLMQN